MSLVGVMIAAALSIVVGLGLASMLSNSNKGVKGVRNRGEFEELKAVVRMMSHSKDKCAGAFHIDSGELIYSDKPTDFKRLQIDGTDIVAVQDPGSVKSGIRVTRLQMIPFTGTGTGVISEGSHPVRIQIDAEIVGESFGARSFSESIPMLISTAATGVIESCDGQSAANPVEELCTRLGLPYDVDTQNCGVPVTSRICDFEAGEVVAGIDPKGQVVCIIPTPPLPPVVVGGGGCSPWVNRKCWALDTTVDGGKGWRSAKTQDRITNYCSTQSATCYAQGGQVTDIDKGAKEKDVEYCSERYGAKHPKAGQCKTWTSKTPSIREHSCACI